MVTIIEIDKESSEENNDCLLLVRSGGVNREDDWEHDWHDDVADDEANGDRNDGGDEDETDVTENHIGWSYRPTHQDLIYHLRRIIEGGRIRCDMLHQVDVYSNFPWEVIAQLSPNLDHQFLVITPRTRTSPKADTFQRTLYGGLGVWKSHGSPQYVTDKNGAVFGLYRSFSFRAGHHTAVYGERSRTWQMVEYDPMLQNHSNLAICLLYEKNTRKAARELDKVEAHLEECIRAEAAASFRVLKAKNKEKQEEDKRRKAALHAEKKRLDVEVKKSRLNLVRLEEALTEQYGVDAVRAAMQQQARARAGQNSSDDDGSC